ncbi:MAG: carboxypeptidase regulatory-like domain-containing protein, partial [Myxococcales bacterium]|nr:carboxypeptidase regulatory-like domain-containing protein [Myxococcales bacterium]
VRPALRTSRLAGVVVEVDDAPVPGALVCVAPGAIGPSFALGWRPRCVRADEQGTFMIEPVAPGRHLLSATARGYIPPPSLRERVGLRVAVAAGQTRDGLVLRLRPGGGEVRGVVRDITGGTVSGAWVFSEGAMTTSDDEGSFSLWLDTRSFVHLSVIADGYAHADLLEHRPIGRVLEVLLRPEVLLTGRVITAEGGEPVAGVAVVATAPGLMGYSGSFSTEPHVFTGEDGRFRFTGLAPGRYKPQVRDGSYRGQARESVLLELGSEPADVVISAHPARRLEGHVQRDRGDVPCEDATVAIHDAAGAVVDRGLADAEGAVAVGGLLPGVYDLEISCDQGRAVDTVDLLEGDVTGALWEVELPTGRAIRGRVVDQSGRGVAMAYLQGELMEPEDDDARAVARAVTEADGAFEILDLPPGVYSFYTVEAEGMAEPIESPSVALARDRDAEGVRIVLPDAGALRVRVRDDDGDPVPGATLLVKREGGGGGPLKSTPDSVWTIDPATPGVYSVKVSRPGVGGRAGPDDPGRADEGAQVEVVAGATAELTLIAKARDGVISGVVRTTDGDLVPDASVWASAGATYVNWGGQERHPTVARAVTDIDGAFTLEHLEDGAYTIHARDQAGVERTVLNVGVGRDDVSIVLPNHGAVSGRVVVRGGEPPAKFSISVRAGEGDRGRSEEFLYTAGEWRVVGLPPGPVTVEARAAEGTASQRVRITEGDERTGLTLTLAARGGVRGRVVDRSTGEPVAGYLVTVSSANGRATASRFDPEGTRRSGPDGAFELREVPSGEVVLHLWPADARRLGYQDREVTLTVGPGKVMDAGAIEVQRRDEGSDADDSSGD